MAALTSGYRQSIADSFDQNRNHYIPSSAYLGASPEVEPLPLSQTVKQSSMQSIRSPATTLPNGGRNGYNGTESFHVQSPFPRSKASADMTKPIFPSRQRNSDALNISDPVAMHLLTETALGDSKNFELLSFEELEQLKRDKTVLKNRIQQTVKKIALETKLRDAAQSLNRLYTKGHRRNATGSSKGSNSDVSVRADDEYIASSKRIGELSRDLEQMKETLDAAQRRILEHTAGILQVTHRGLKKNLRKHELPRSPESMASGGHRSISGGPLLDEFDERSLYPVPDYVNDFVGTSPITPTIGSTALGTEDMQAINGMSTRLEELTSRLHRLILQSSVAEDVPQPPISIGPDASKKGHSQIDAQLTFLSQALDALSASQQLTLQQSEDVNTRIHDMLERTNSISRSPLLPHDEPRGDDLTSQLAFSTRVLEQLHSRIETLVEQKDILTRQIQQQRELNSKSDAQRDAQIHDLTEELADAQRKQGMSEKEAQQYQNQISQLIDQVDRARDDKQLLEQQEGMNANKALEAEREARKRTENELLEQVNSEQQKNTQLHADLTKIQHDFELRSQQHVQQLNDLSQAKEQVEIESKGYQSEAEKLLEQIAGIQTELVMAKAELDGAYGSRAQRAADVSSNPAIQKQIDDLQRRNAELQKELQDTIADYEQMTKESIEFEKERDNLEASIDSLRDKCESFESQLNEEKLKAIGSKPTGTNDTTSTMVLKNEFKKMMRDTRAENMKALRHEQEERRRLESVIRQMKKDMGIATPIKSAHSMSHLSAGPA